MNIKIMKFIDKYVGAPVCLVLFLFDKVFGGFSRKPFQNVKKILVIKFWGLGSIILASPAIKALKDKYPDSSLTILTLCSNEEICLMINGIDQVICLEIRKGLYKFLIDTLKIIRTLRKEKFDIALDFEFFTRFSAIITYLSGAPKRIGFHAFEVWRGKLHTKEVPFNRYWHVSKNFMNLTSAAGLEEKLIYIDPKNIAIEGNDFKFLSELFQPNDFNNEKLLVININAADLALERRWPFESFLELSRKLLTFNEVQLAFIGGDEDVQYVSEMVGQLSNPNVIDLSGRLTIHQLAALLSKSALLITNDSGPLHLAVAVGVPTASLFGPETPVLYGPIGKKHKIFFKGIDCSPCINVHDSKTVRCRTGKAKCMSSIDVDSVFSAISEYLISSSFWEN